MSLWVPQAEQSRRLEGQRVANAQALQVAEVGERMKHWNRELRKVDNYVELFKAPGNAVHPGVTPGYWHILRRPPGGQPTFIAHKDPHTGEYRDLDSGLFDALRKGDMWNSERQRDREKMIRAAERAQERAEEREREERIEEIMDRAKAAWNPGVSMAGSWTNKAGARRG